MVTRAVALWLCVLILLAHHASCCPTVCRCIGQQRVTVYCDYKGLEVRCSCVPPKHLRKSLGELYEKTVPPNIPLETTHLFLMGNKFKSVLPSMLRGNAKNSDGTFATDQSALTNLTVIRLDLNPIAIVNEHAFLPAPSLKLIYLPFDVKIQRQAFAEMKNDKDSFDGFTRVATHPLEDPLFVAFSSY